MVVKFRSKTWRAGFGKEPTVTGTDVPSGTDKAITRAFLRHIRARIAFHGDRITNVRTIKS